MDVIYTDIKKVFDTANIIALIAKLKSIGVNRFLLKWVSSYLSDCTQQVKIRQWLSEILKVVSGIPQGGHLSP